MPTNKTNETSPTGIIRAGDPGGVSETGQPMGAYKMDGDIDAIRHRMREQTHPVVCGDHNKEPEYNRKGPETFPTRAMIQGPMMTGSTEYSAKS